MLTHVAAAMFVGDVVGMVVIRSAVEEVATSGIFGTHVLSAAVDETPHDSFMSLRRVPRVRGAINGTVIVMAMMAPAFMTLLRNPIMRRGDTR